MSSVTERAAASPAPVRRRRVASVVQGLAIAVGFAMLVGGFGLIALDYRPYRVPTTSMSPTVEPGDTLLARKVGGGSVGRGDIVVFNEKAWGGATMVKRVVAVGGDTVTCCDPAGRITVNGVGVDEPYADERNGGGTAFSITVPEGRLFLLGDSRINSLDSRSHLDVAGGTVATSDVVAKVEAIAWPSSRATLLARTAAFDALKGPAATRPGLLAPAGYAAVGGAALVLIAALMGWLASSAQRLAARRGA